MKSSRMFYVGLAVAVVFAAVAASEYRVSRLPGALVGVDFLGIPWQSILSAIVSAIGAFIARRFGASKTRWGAAESEPAVATSEEEHFASLAAIYAFEADMEASELLMALVVKRKEGRK